MLISRTPRCLSRALRHFTTHPNLPANHRPLSMDSLKVAPATLLIAGLGNTSHPRTRHNVGFAAVDALVASQRSKLVQSWTLSKAVGGSVAIARFESADFDFAKTATRRKRTQNQEEKNEEVDNQWSVRVIFLKPKGFMNLSGVSVGKAAREYAISPSNILVLHDDLEKPLGRVSLKLSGSANGHNGLRSIISTLHTDAFGRARIGIGRPTNKDDVADYVLQRFHLDEEEMLEEEVYAAVWDTVQQWILVRLKNQ